MWPGAPRAAISLPPNNEWGLKQVIKRLVALKVQLSVLEAAGG